MMCRLLLAFLFVFCLAGCSSATSKEPVEKTIDFKIQGTHTTVEPVITGQTSGVTTSHAAAFYLVADDGFFCEVTMAEWIHTKHGDKWSSKYWTYK